MKPIVLVIENAIAVTGSLKSVMRSCFTLSDDFEFIFILPTQSRAKSFVEKGGFEVYELPLLEIARSWRVLLYLPVLFLNTRRLVKILSKKKIDLIVVNDFYNMLPALSKLLGSRVPYVTFVRFVPNRFPEMLVNTWCFFHFKLADKIIAVSKVVQNNLKPHPKVILIYNELPIEDGYQFYPYDQNARTILYLSNYISGKGLEYAIQAFSSVGKEFSEWTLRFVGDDMGLTKNKLYKKSLHKLAEDLNVSQRIEWSDFNENVIDEYKRSALVLNFSDSESFSLICVEAMTIGRPVIATKSGGPQEIIEPGFDGELVEIRNVPQMVEALRKLLSDASLRTTYSERAHASVTTKFSLENTAYKLRPIYLEAINKSR